MKVVIVVHPSQKFALKKHVKTIAKDLNKEFELGATQVSFKTSSKCEKDKLLVFDEKGGLLVVVQLEFTQFDFSRFDA